MTLLKSYRGLSESERTYWPRQMDKRADKLPRIGWTDSCTHTDRWTDKLMEKPTHPARCINHHALVNTLNTYILGFLFLRIQWRQCTQLHITCYMKKLCCDFFLNLSTALIFDIRPTSTRSFHNHGQANPERWMNKLTGRLDLSRCPLVGVVVQWLDYLAVTQELGVRFPATAEKCHIMWRSLVDMA